MNIKNRRNYYRLLQVQPDASLEVIKASYRTLMQKLRYHPDLGGDQWNAALINEAYGVLSDPDKRTAYDKALSRLIDRVGAHGRAKSRSNDAPPAARGSAAGEQSKGTPEVVCPFCQSRNAVGGYGAATGHCTVCASPLRLVWTEPHAAHQRGSRRIPHAAWIRYVLSWPPGEVNRGQMADLSPTGMRFVAARALAPGTLLKVDGDELAGVARVTHCRPEGEGFSVGVRFLSLSLHNDRGTFVSENV